MGPIAVSAVVPRHDPRASLRPILGALAGQTRRPNEVIITDSNDPPLDEAELRRAHPELSLRILTGPANLAAQLNHAIRGARGTHVLLCTTQVEPPPTYLERLLAHLEQSPSCGAVTGLVCDPSAVGIYAGDIQVPTARHVLFAFLFQRSLNGPVECVPDHGPWATLLREAKRWYRRRGNTWSLAGWPLITKFDGPVLHAAVYYLSCGLIRRDWLLGSPYDERLGQYGIGLNYSVALGLPGPAPIAILTDMRLTQHEPPGGGLAPEAAHYHRALALDYLVRTHPRFTGASRGWLVWSLVGTTVAAAVRRQWGFARASVRAAWTVITGTNPYDRGLPDGPRDP